MKKLLLSAALVFSAFAANAQEIKTNAGTFSKPTAGSIITEFNFTPNITGGNLFTQANENGVVGIKARKFISETKAYRAIGNLSVGNTNTVGNNKTDFNLEVGVGIEKHLAGAERLSTYYGYQASIGFDNQANANVEIFSLNAQAFTGMDYYIMPKVYLGAEISYGASFFNTNNAGVAPTATTFRMNSGIKPTLRFGWIF